jgi:hypothetical protein
MSYPCTFRLSPPPKRSDYFRTITPNPFAFVSFRDDVDDDELEPSSCFRRIEPALLVDLGREVEDDDSLRPRPPDEPDALEVDFPVTILSRSASSSFSNLANLNIFSASSLVFASSSKSFNSSGNAYLFLIALSASRFRFSTFFSSRKSLRTRAECANGSAL